MEATTTAAVIRIENMLTAAVLLALGLVSSVTGYGYPGSRRVRLEVECEDGRETQVQEIAQRCDQGRLEGIMVDVGKYQAAFRQVSNIVDEARAGATKERMNTR
jgi:hypothetical protein